MPRQMNLFLYKIIVFCCFGTLSSTLLAQTKGDYLNASVGYINHHFNDARHSSIFRNAGGVGGILQYEAVRDLEIHRLQLQVALATTHQEFASVSTNTHGTLRYEYCRALTGLQGVYVGGYVDFSALLLERSGLWTDPGAALSYVLSSSLGGLIRYSAPLGESWSVNTAAYLSLLNYVVRPAFGFPYPASFLRDGRFSFNLNGLAGDIVQSGIVQTLDTFVNTTFSAEITRDVGDSGHKVGLLYVGNYLFAGGTKPFFGVQNFAGISFHYNLSGKQ
jgi:hypothetical protein